MYVIFVSFGMASFRNESNDSYWVEELGIEKTELVLLSLCVVCSKKKKRGNPVLIPRTKLYQRLLMGQTKCVAPNPCFFVICYIVKLSLVLFVRYLPKQYRITNLHLGVLAVDSFGFSNSYIWFEFYNTPLEQDVTLISDVSNLSCLEIVTL